jgi:hypothetical protein
VAYADTDDVIDRTFVATQMPHEEWNDHDRSLVLSVLGQIDRRRCSIDAGAGTGRLLDTLTQSFAQVYAIEPDISRFDALRARLRATPSLARCIPLNTELDAAAICRADFVLCSHVLQHLPSCSISRFLSSLAEHVLPATGKVLLTTSVATEPRCYVACLTDEPAVVAREIDASEFDIWAVDPPRATLPVRHFAEQELVGRLQAAGFALVWVRPYRSFTFEAIQVDFDGSTVQRSAMDMALLLELA